MTAPAKTKALVNPTRIQRRILFAEEDRLRLDFEPGTWAQIPRSLMERQCYNRLTAEDRRVYWCIVLASFGCPTGAQQLAIVIETDKDEFGRQTETTRVLKASDIARKTGLLMRSVLRSLKALEQAGLIERRALRGGLHHRGNVGIYCLPEPLPVTKEQFECRARHSKFNPTNPVHALLGKELFHELRRDKWEIPDTLSVARDIQSAILEAARAIQAKEEAVARVGKMLVCMTEKGENEGESPAPSLYEQLEQGENKTSSSSTEQHGKQSRHARRKPPVSTTTKTHSDAQQPPESSPEPQSEFRTRLDALCASAADPFQCTDRQFEEIRISIGEHWQEWLKHLDKPQLRGIRNPGGLLTDAATFIRILRNKHQSADADAAAQAEAESRWQERDRDNQIDLALWVLKNSESTVEDKENALATLDRYHVPSRNDDPPAEPPPKPEEVDSPPVPEWKRPPI